MAQEIERKFLVDEAKLPPLPKPIAIRQGYIPSEGITVRVRMADHCAYLTLKGESSGISRTEFEYPIPSDEAEEMLKSLCIQPYIDKKRYLIVYEEHTWELDIFEGENAGLIVAEIELKEEDETFAKPPWITKEVSHDPRYRNAALILHPYHMWD